MYLHVIVALHLSRVPHSSHHIPMSSESSYLDTCALKFSQPLDQLHGVPERTLCPKCNARRRYYCYDCIVPIGHTPPVPLTRLPVQFHIIRHQSEKTSKSSIIPLKMTYREDVHLYTFAPPDRFNKDDKEGVITPPFPDNMDWTRAAILFPGTNAVGVNEMGDDQWEGETAIEHIIVIDSTWSTALQVIQKTKNLKAVRHMIKLSSSNKTIFWRHQAIGRECLATCEAIYVLLREVWDRKGDAAGVYDRRYDDVLYYYIFIHSLVNDSYRDTKRHRGHLPDYAIVGDK